MQDSLDAQRYRMLRQYTLLVGTFDNKNFTVKCPSGILSWGGTCRGESCTGEVLDIMVDEMLFGIRTENNRNNLQGEKLPMDINLDLKRDSANTYINDRTLNVKDQDDNVQITLECPDRVVCVNKAELKAALSIM